jgi:hypothetical protein
VVAKLIPRMAETGGGIEAVMSRVISHFERYVKLSNNLHYDAMLAAVRVEDPGKLADVVASHLVVPLEEKQNLLEIFSPQERLVRIAQILEAEAETLQVEKRQVEKRQVEKRQVSPARLEVAPPLDLKPEDVLLRMVEARLRVNGQPAGPASPGAGSRESASAGGGSVEGEVLWVEVPGHGRAFLSLSLRPGYDFKKSGVVSGDRVLFALDGDLCEWISKWPIATAGLPSFQNVQSWYVWVLHDAEYVPAVGSSGGAGAGLTKVL